MSDNGDPKSKAGISSWQQSPQDSRSSPTDTPNDTNVTSGKPSSTVNVTTTEARTQDDASMQLALKFLQDPAIRDTSTSSKADFLQSKGISQDVIQRAIDTMEIEAYTEDVEGGDVQSTIPHAPTRSAPFPANTSYSIQEQVPIITYPEYVLQHSKPPPIVTIGRLMNTAYVAAATAAVVYGASKYLVEPMFQALSLARHDLAGNTLRNIEQLNEKLAGITKDTTRAQGINALVDAGDDDASLDSDPTELFHRDFGTQTSPALEVNSDSSSTLSDESRTTDGIGSQVEQLRKLKNYCADLIQDTSDEYKSTEDSRTVIKVLKEQLDSMMWSNRSYNNMMGFPSSTNIGKKTPDEATRLRDEIRGMKGLMLSAKSFPASAGRPSPVNANLGT